MKYTCDKNVMFYDECDIILLKSKNKKFRLTLDNNFHVSLFSICLIFWLVYSDSQCKLNVNGRADISEVSWY